MRVILDTNVFISGVFFSGPPYQILDAWRRGGVDLVLSPEILDEYLATADELSAQFPAVDLSPWITLLAAKAVIIEASTLLGPVCTDPDDDKFLACALASRTKLIVTGDKALLRVSGYKGIEVLTPRRFVDQHLTSAILSLTRANDQPQYWNPFPRPGSGAGVPPLIMPGSPG